MQLASYLEVNVLFAQVGLIKARAAYILQVLAETLPIGTGPRNAFSENPQLQIPIPVPTPPYSG
jgi:hypothetical protein